MDSLKISPSRTHYLLGSPRGELTLLDGTRLRVFSQYRGWTLLAKVHGTIDRARRDYLYGWAIRTFAL